MYQHILCPVDGSPTSNSGMHEAIQLAKQLNANIRFIHVIDLYVPVFDPMGDFNVVYVDDILRKNAKTVLEKAVVAAREKGVAAESEVRETLGNRVSKLVIEEAEAWPADLIVMGTHGLRGMERLVLGSDAETIVRKSAVPVLLVNNSTKKT
ncbi:MAG: universal stress protein [Methylophilaceae bacterium]